MKSAVLWWADSICICCIFHSFDASTCFITPLRSLSAYHPHFCFNLFVVALFVSASATWSVYLSPHSLFVCVGLWAGLWQGWCWLNLPQASNGKERDKRCHIMRGLLSWLWLRVVIQNWWREELELTSCQRWMFSKGRQASSDDNVGYAP